MNVSLPAKLAYVTEVRPGRVVITLHTEQVEASAILDAGQLANLVSDGAKFMRPFMEAKS